MPENYYRLLGLHQGASVDEIRRQYRRLLKRYHPDTGGVQASVEMLAQVRQAWAVLSDPQRRQQYDRSLQQPPRSQASAQTRANTTTGQNRQRGTPSPWNTVPAGGRQGPGFQQLFRKVFRERYRQEAPARAVDGRDIHVRVEVDLETAFRGGKQQIRLPADVHHPQRQVVEVELPAGVRHEQVLRFPALGFPGVAGGKSGDLLVKVGIRPHPRMQIEGKDVLYHLPLWPWDLMLGAEVTIEALGERLRVQVPAGTAPRTRLRLHGKGFGPAPRGDLLVIVDVETPAPDSQKKRQLLQELARLYGKRS